jgi:Domain of unknown function (DUF5655)
MNTARPLWTCPDCGRRFANRNQTHSCGPFSEADHLARMTPHVRELYDGFVRLVDECGPHVLAPAKTRIGFQVRMIFADVVPQKASLHAYVILARRLEHPRFTRIESLGPRSHVHHFRIRRADELDDDVGAWLREAYAVGEQRHLTRAT